MVAVGSVPWGLWPAMSGLAVTTIFSIAAGYRASSSSRQ
ncbi:hypothetical protein M877_00015 [Streptomyces niveus NCIMB 11891]|nr:hypothetical protein M877_00015 [Streptomyces niveus NCIMB 11891]